MNELSGTTLAANAQKTTSRVQYEIAYHVGRYVSSSTAS